MSRYADRVMETSTTTGVGDITVSGSVTGYQTWSTGIPENIMTDYAIVGVDANGTPTGEWETGEGYRTGATTIVRAFPAAGSSTVPVNFSAGTKRVFNTLIAREIITPGRSLAMSQSAGMP